MTGILSISIHSNQQLPTYSRIGRSTTEHRSSEPQDWDLGLAVMGWARSAEAGWAWAWAWCSYSTSTSTDDLSSYSCCAAKLTWSWAWQCHGHIEGTTRRVRQADTPVICWFPLIRYLSYFQLPGTRTLCVHIIDTKDLGFWSGIIVVIFIPVTRFTPSPFISLSLSCLWVASWNLA